MTVMEECCFFGLYDVSNFDIWKWRLGSTLYKLWIKKEFTVEMWKQFEIVKCKYGASLSCLL